MTQEANMSLSRFFSLQEMTHSDTASRENIPNLPATAELENLRALCAAVLDPLRETIGKPITVNSGFRGAALNRRIGGATRSQHLEGKAADIQARGISVLELFKTVIRLNLPFDQLIYEAQSRTAKWVHVSHDPQRDRRQIMIAEFGPNGRPVRYPVISAEAALVMSEPAQAVTRSGMAPELTYSELSDEPEDMNELQPTSGSGEASSRPRRDALTKKKRKKAATPTRARRSVRKATVRAPNKKLRSGKRKIAATSKRRISRK
jgi:hypothetical protein